MMMSRRTVYIRSSNGLRKGTWSAEEDNLLRQCIDKYGEGKWLLIPQRAGLNRCGKSCRLRWLNYLEPNIKRGKFNSYEVDLLLRLHKLLGNRWSLIAGRLPGRTANDVKNYWNTHFGKKEESCGKSKTRKREITCSGTSSPTLNPQSCNGEPEAGFGELSNKGGFGEVSNKDDEEEINE